MEAMNEGRRIQVNESKPFNDQMSSIYSQNGNDNVVFQRLQQLNQLQREKIEEAETIKNIYQKEEEFVTLLLTIEGEKLSRELFGLLFDLLIGNSGNTKESEGDFFYIFFELLKRGKTEIPFQLSLLKELNQLVANYTTLKHYCFRKKWVLRLLQMLPTVEDERIIAEFIHLIKSIATMSISTHEMQTIFRMMNTESSTFKPSHLSLLLDVMQLISKRFGPDIFFDFIGPQASILLPEFPKGWPGGEGYSFCTWFRVESFEHPTIKQEYRPSLFTLHSPEGSGIEVFFSHKNLVVQIYNNKNKTASKLDYTFQEGQWYFIVLSHTYHFIRRSEFSLYVNGALASSVALNYPKIEKPIKTAIIGNSLAAVIKEKSSSILLQPFYGQMSGFFFFNSPFAKHEDVVSVNLLGPNFIPVIDQDDGKIISGMSNGLFYLDGKRTLKVLFAYNPKAVLNGLVCLDTSAIESRRIAKLQDGTQSIRTHGIKETLYCIGGIRVLLPMFRTLDQPIVSELLKLDFDSQEAAKVDPMFALQVFSLLENMLQNNPQNQEQMVLAHGFQVIGYLLENVNPQCWTKSTIDSIERLSIAIQSCESLFRQLFLNIYLNFRLWIYTSADVQLELFSVLSKHVKKQPQYFRSLITVQKLIDTIRTYYWFTAESCSLATQPIINPNTFETLGIRPDHVTIKKIRVAILQLTRTMTLDEYTFDEIKGFVYYLEDCQDPEQGTDVLQMLLFLLSSKKGTICADTCEYLYQLGGILPFFGVLKRNNANLRVWSLKMIGKILQITINTKKKEKLLGNNRLISIKHYLEPFPFVENTYYALLEVLLENVDILSIKNPLSNEEDEFLFKNTTVLSAIFELVCTSGQSSLQQKVLQDFVFLLNQSPLNRSAFLKQLHWQNWLFGILANNPSNQEIFKQVVKILTLLFHHCFYESNGHVAFSETHSLLSHFGERGFFNHLELLRELNSSVLRSIQYDSKIIQQAKKVPIIWENIIRWLSFTEDCLFLITSESSMDSHFLLAIHRRYDGTWIDFEFSQKLLEYLDSLILSHSHADESVVTPDSEESLMRLSLRLTLYTLYETDALLNTDKIRERSSNLKKMESAVEQFFTSISSPTSNNTKVKETLGQYLQGKIKHWNGEMNSVDRVFQNNIDRLRNLVRKINSDQISPFASSRILYIISYLYSAMKRSYERQGIGAELILGIFKEVLISFRPKIITYLQVESLSDEKFIEFFMREFSAVSDLHPSPLIQLVMSGVREIITDEEQFIYKTLENLSSSKQRMAESIDKHMKNDLMIHSAGESEFSQLLEKHRSEELERLSILNRSINQTRRIRLKKCKATLNELSHERGPWCTPQTLSEIPHWKLDRTEDPLRRRFKLKRNRNYRDYSHCAKGLQNYNNIITIHNPETGEYSSLNYKQLSSTTDPNNNVEEVSESFLNEESPVTPDDEEKLLYIVDCDLITPMSVTPGRLEITTTNIYFIVSKESNDDSNNQTMVMMNNNSQNSNHQSSSSSASSLLLSKVYQKKQNSRKWPIKNIQALYSRRYMLRQSGLEIQLIDRTMNFINLSSQSERDRVWKKILSLRPPSIDASTSSTSLIGSGLPLTGSQLLKKSDLTNKWKNREISNFEYLMALNTFAGRTYNDLTQYPIFPWIIQDYSSSYLDLSNPSTFRDLSKPIGALNPQRLQSFIDRYNSFEDPTIPKFHYGSHYSNVGIVLFYLLRQEPFTSYFLTLQGGKFDHPSRMFMSIRETWNNCLTNPSDVKELIPEFFYFPEFLENTNDYIFGYNGEYEDKRSVELPPWATSARDFVEKNRQALESEYVSQHLHEWIDLIFGCKQRGAAAEEAFNVFFYLTYEGAIDIESVIDPVERRSIEAQIINFGQTPSQLFEKPHPSRRPINELRSQSRSSLSRSSSSANSLNHSNPNLLSSSSPANHSLSSSIYDQPECFEIITKVVNPIIFLHCYADKLVFIASDGVLAICSIIVGRSEKSLPFSFEVDKSLNTKNQRQIDMFFPESMPSIGRCFLVSKDGKYLISCGSWDDSIECRMLSTAKKLPEIGEHRNIVTCIALGKDGSTLVSGSKDCTVIVWQFDANENNSPANFGFWARNQKKKKGNGVFRFKRILYGHTDCVNSVDVNVDLDCVVSGSKDQSLIIFSLRKGKFIRSISFPSSVTNVKLNNDGVIAVYCEPIKMLYTYSINGVLLGKAMSLLDKLLAWSFSVDGKYLITAGIGNYILFRSVSSLEIVFIIDSSEPVCSLRVLSNKEFCCIVCGLKSGKLNIYPFPSILLSN